MELTEHSTSTSTLCGQQHLAHPHYHFDGQKSLVTLAHPGYLPFSIQGAW